MRACVRECVRACLLGSSRRRGLLAS